MSDIAIRVEHLRKSYGAFVAVEDVSFEVEAGEIFGILGPNGAGKTTTVECLQGLRRADGGQLRVLGLDPGQQAGELRRRIGSQLQESALPDRMKVWEALDLFASLHGLRSDWRDVMEQWGLAGKAHATFGSLSGGERQRLFVALALVNRPELVFLDEMTTGLDPAARRVAWELIEQIQERGTTVVLVTHFMDEAERLCDRVAVIHDRRVVALDTPRGLVARYAGTVKVSFTTGHVDLAFLDTVTGVETIERSGHLVTVAGTGPLLARVAAALVAHGLAPADLRTEGAALEDVFLALTGEGPS